MNLHQPPILNGVQVVLIHPELEAAELNIQVPMPHNNRSQGHGERQGHLVNEIVGQRHTRDRKTNPSF